MLNDAFYWLSSFHKSEWIITFSGLFLLDSPRYILTSLLMVCYDIFVLSFHKKANKDIAYYPSVCAIIACLNEADNIYGTLKSVYGSYPFLEIIVIDDGSTDDTYALSEKFAREVDYKNIQVIKRARRGGKSSAINIGLFYAKSEIVINLDSDSTFGPNAIFNIVQPFKDPKVGAVGGDIIVSNPFASIWTWFQAYEYLNTITVGRLFASRVGMLRIASGAFSAFRRDAVNRGYGWDAGQGEDFCTTVRMCNQGWKVVHQLNAQCFTDAPEKFMQIVRQRKRWDLSLVAYSMRKHRSNLANILSHNFRFTSLLYWLDTVYFGIFCSLSFWVVSGLFVYFNEGATILNFLVTILLAYMGLSVIQVLVICFYTNDLKRDLPVCAIAPLFPFYAFILRIIRTYALYMETFYKISYNDPYVPEYVRKVRIRF